MEPEIKDEAKNTAQVEDKVAAHISVPKREEDEEDGNCRPRDAKRRWYSKKGCFIQSLQIDNQFYKAWNALGKEGGGTVRGIQYSENDCYIKALEIMKALEIEQQFHQAQAWNGLGQAGGGTVDGTQYSQKDCYIKALEIMKALEHKQ